MQHIWNYKAYIYKSYYFL